jgi:protein phosphatase
MDEMRTGGGVESKHPLVSKAGGSGLQFHVPVQVEVAGLSHPGRVRLNNEDHFYIGRFGRFFETLQTNLSSEKSVNRSEEASYGMLVTDGVGGGAAGEVASREAIHLLLGLVLQAPDWIFRPDDDAATQQILRRAATRVAQINQALGEQARIDSELHGFGTTFTAVWNLGRHLFVAHVGDSRAYLFRRQTLEQLTHDHTFAQHLVDRGVISSEEISKHRMRHVLTRALGDTDVEGAPELRQLHLRTTTVFVCSDGLTTWSRSADRRHLNRCWDVPACVPTFRASIERWRKDNITVAVARYRSNHRIRTGWPRLAAAVLSSSGPTRELAVAWRCFQVYQQSITLPPYYCHRLKSFFPWSSP